MSELNTRVRRAKANRDLGTGLAHALELSGRWRVPRCMPLPRVPCPASRRAWHNLVKPQAQEPQKQVFGDDATSCDGSPCSPCPQFAA